MFLGGRAAADPLRRFASKGFIVRALASTLWRSSGPTIVIEIVMIFFFVTPVIGVTGKVDGPATGGALATIVHRLFMPREESRRAVRP